MPDPKILISQERLKALVYYDPETGIFTAIQKRTGIAPGKVLGSIGKKGYRYIMIERVFYKANRLAWFYMTGEWPTNLIDHKDRNKGNDRWKNLRPATNVENGQNAKIPKNNSSGVCGVSWRKSSGRWQAGITIFYKRINLGTFVNKDDAIAARKAAEVKYFGDFAPV